MKNVLTRPLAALSLGILSLGSACSWGRFDDATDQPAIVVLHASEATGDVIDVRASKDQQPVLFSIVPRGTSFFSWQIGDPDNPNDNGRGGKYEPPSDDADVRPVPSTATLNAGSVAYIGKADATASGGVQGECWVHGFRARPKSEKFATGFAATCITPDGSSRGSTVSNIHPDLNNSAARDTPDASFDERHKNDAVLRTVLGANAEGQTDKFLFPNLASFASWDGGHFVVGTPDIYRAFVYIHLAPGTPFDSAGAAWGAAEPIALEADKERAEDRSFGAAVTTIPATAATPTSLGVAVAEPVTGKIFLYDIDTKTRTSTRRGCIAGAALSGIVLHGYADNGKRVLAASNATGTVVLYDFDAVSGEACAAATPLATLICADTGDVTGCGDGAFGYSLGHGDLDGDGDQELLVGAPGMNAREKVNAGAVYVYDLEAFAPTTSDVLFLGNPKNGSLLGSSLSTMRSGTRDLPVASAPGSRDVMVFYCGALSKSSPRCQ